MTLALRIVAHSEIGLVRKNNQDSGYASPTLVVVADGMGGAAAGDLASSVAIAELVKADGHYAGEEMLEALAGAVVRANDRMVPCSTASGWASSTSATPGATSGATASWSVSRTTTRGCRRSSTRAGSPRPSRSTIPTAPSS